MFRVAGAQMRVTIDVEVNEPALLDAVERAAAAGAEILLTPEGSLSGYTADFDHNEVAAALARVTEAARRRQLGLALGTCLVEAVGAVTTRFGVTAGTARFWAFTPRPSPAAPSPPRPEVRSNASPWHR